MLRLRTSALFIIIFDLTVQEDATTLYLKVTFYTVNFIYLGFVKMLWFLCIPSALASSAGGASASGSSSSSISVVDFLAFARFGPASSNPTLPIQRLYNDNQVSEA